MAADNTRPALPKEALDEIDKFLKQVRQAVAGRSPEEREELVQSLEEHIFDALAELDVSHPSRKEVVEVLRRMDAPALYRSAPEDIKETALATPSQSRLGRIAMWMFGAAIVIPLAGFTFANFTDADIAKLAMLAGLVLMIAALVFGAMGRKHPMGKAVMIICLALLALVTLVVPVEQIESTNGQYRESLDGATTEPSG